MGRPQKCKIPNFHQVCDAVVKLGKETFVALDQAESYRSKVIMDVLLQISGVTGVGQQAWLFRKGKCNLHDLRIKIADTLNIPHDIPQSKSSDSFISSATSS